ncbi:hypothetical protein CGERO_04555 [Corynebacterium gerontici]|uniref:EfeO-type cupredoxin-like domain-containing protein n=2 Tax=Corynebacterium gerontici TaxID=2079234 RepID=A0A3G6IZU9_9CORY|nr:hypothetical protein CGERO_04555 [Corynebacterium gerontici]
MQVGISDVSLAQRARWHRGIFLVLGFWSCVSVAGWLAHRSWVQVSWWQLIHSATLGVIATAILTYITHFTEALTRSAHTGFRGVTIRVGMVQVGLVVLLLGDPSTAWGPLEIFGAVLVLLAGAMQLGWVIKRLFGSLSGHFALSVTMYVGALVSLLVAIICAILAGSGLGAYSALIAAHSRAAIWGFVGMSILGTVLTLLPTLSGTKISAVARVRFLKGLGFYSLCLIHAVWLLGFNLPRIAGVFMLGVVVASVYLLHPIIADALGGNVASAPGGLIAALMSLVSLQLFDATALTFGRDPHAVFESLVPGLLAAVLLMAVFSVLQFLLPTMVGGGPDAVRAARGCAQRSGYARVVLLLLGGILGVLGHPAAWPLIGLGVIWNVAAIGRAVVMQGKREEHSVEKSTSRLAWAMVGAALAAAMVMFFGVAQPAQPAAAGDEVVRVRIEGLRFVPDEVTVPEGTSLRIELENTSTMVHDLVLGDQQTRRVQPGERDAIELRPSRDVEGWCSLPGHKEAGMVFSLRVTPAQAG